MKTPAGLLVLLLLVSCAPFSRDLLVRVDKGLTFPEVQGNPGAHKGKTVLWGGVIVETANRPTETSILIRQTGLDAESRPRNKDRSLGRFIALVPGFLDPAIYRAEREITAVGEVLGSQTLPVGGSPYSYPVIGARQIHLWELRPAYSPYYDPYPPWPFGPFWPRSHWRWRPYYW